MRWIAHLDLDAFYASVEQRDRPEWRGRPVVVGGSPRSRGVVCAASYEARAFGIRSAMPCAQAARLCPEAIFVAPDFTRYGEASRRIHALFHEITDLVEPLSLDEAFLDLAVAVAGGRDPADLIAELRRRIRSETGLTASAGIAPNKFLAKIASDACKPDGLRVIHHHQAATVARALPVEAIPGVGRVTAERLHGLGLRRAQDLLRIGIDRLRLACGSQAEWLLACAEGQDDRPVNADQERKSVGIEDTFDRDLDEPSALIARLDALAEGLATRLDQAGVRGRTLTLKIKWHDFRLTTRSRSFHDPIAEVGVLREQGGALLADLLPGRGPIRLLGLSLSQLDEGGAGTQQTLDFAATFAA